MRCMRAGSLPPFARRMRRGRLLAAAGAWLLLGSIAAFGASSVQRCTDKDGKVTYSDRPCQNESAKAAPAPPPAVSRTEPKAGLVSYAQDSNVFQDLQGSWSAANVTLNGKLHLDRELMRRTWIFRTDDLYIESDVPQKKPRHFTVEVDRGAQPGAVHLTASTAADRDGWLIYAKERGALRIAFYPDFQRRHRQLRCQRRVAGHSPCASLRVGSDFRDRRMWNPAGRRRVRTPRHGQGPADQPPGRRRRFRVQGVAGS